MAHLVYALGVIGLIFGFGFVVFFHELGHFLAAKWVGIKVEQFAVGFGQAVFSWRKGMGFSWGSSRVPFETRLTGYLREKGLLPTEADAEPTPQQMRSAAEALGFSETEYRLNWIPLGGYVKMLGQDDIKPGSAAVEDPRAYNRKSIGARMIVVSAGVIMNIILAAVGFMVLFLIGFNAPPPVVGTVLNYSPAQRAGILVGDRIVSINGRFQHEFTKIMLNVALLSDKEDAQFVVKRPGVDHLLTFNIRPEHGGEGKAFLAVGITPTEELKSPEPDEVNLDLYKDPTVNFDPANQIMPGDKIVKINDTPVAEVAKEAGYPLLYEAIQKADGQPVNMQVERDGKPIALQIHSHFAPPFVEPLTLAGMEPRSQVNSVLPEAAIKGKVLPGDVIVSAALDGQIAQAVGYDGIISLAKKAYDENKHITLNVLRDGKALPLSDLKPVNLRQGTGKRGLGMGLTTAEENLGIGNVEQNSPAAKAGIAPGATIQKVDGKQVKNWFEIRDALATAGNHTITAIGAGATEARDYTLSVADDQAHAIAALTLIPEIALRALREPRKTSSPLVAAQWGVVETRDFILQFYVTLQRMFQGSISASNMMGPVGILTAGATFASRGVDWLIWFLAMISANLAVVNFLPIPIVDGGLFTFLIIEKIQGRPLSNRAQTWFQIAGLGLIISIFLVVTYHDILRLVN